MEYGLAEMRQPGGAVCKPKKLKNKWITQEFEVKEILSHLDHQNS